VTSSNPTGRSSRYCTAFALGLTLALLPMLAHAGVLVSGTPGAVSLEVEKATIGDVLAALSKAFDLRYRSSVVLDKQLSGKYQGSLKQVLGLVLQDHTYVVKVDDAKLELTVLGRGGAPASAGGAAVLSAGGTPETKSSAPAARPGVGPIPLATKAGAAELPASSPSTDPRLIPNPQPFSVMPPLPVSEAIPQPIPQPQGLPQPGRRE
jgi:hypothetical protein